MTKPVKHNSQNVVSNSCNGQVIYVLLHSSPLNLYSSRYLTADMTDPFCPSTACFLKWMPSVESNLCFSQSSSSGVSCKTNNLASLHRVQFDTGLLQVATLLLHTAQVPS